MPLAAAHSHGHGASEDCNSSSSLLFHIQQVGSAASSLSAWTEVHSNMDKSTLVISTGGVVPSLGPLLNSYFDK